MTKLQEEDGRVFYGQEYKIRYCKSGIKITLLIRLLQVQRLMTVS